MYTGPEFSLDSRLAQIVAFIWVTLTYGTGMPMLFFLSAFNFTLIYFIDKYLLLRFYKNPTNYDEKSVLYCVEKMKFAFGFHFLVGFMMISQIKSYQDPE
jgi:hypothetical protein